MYSRLIGEKKYLKLYSNCIPVKGASRSIICDLQLAKYSYITNDLYDILVNYQKVRLDILYTHFSPEEYETLDEYFNFILDFEYGFLCDLEEIDLFPPLDLIWDRPSLITNAIIDIDQNSSHQFISVFNQLEELGCDSLQLRFFCMVTLKEVSKIIDGLKESRIASLEILLPYLENISESDLQNFLRTNLRINSLVFHSAPENKKWAQKAPSASLSYTQNKIEDESHCGVISKRYFSVNIDFFTESQENNSCLNRKVSIDRFGYIKNCPSMKEHFGHVSKIKLKDVVGLDNFIKTGKITKNQIEVCKDCEFRFICSDCRAYLEDSGNILSKPKKCNYNPYLEIWEI